MAVSHFSPQFQISAWAETTHVITTKFQPGLKFITCKFVGLEIIPVEVCSFCLIRSLLIQKVVALSPAMKVSIGKVSVFIAHTL